MKRYFKITTGSMEMFLSAVLGIIFSLELCPPGFVPIFLMASPLQLLQLTDQGERERGPMVMMTKGGLFCRIMFSKCLVRSRMRAGARLRMGH